LTLDFQRVACVADAADNVAIASRRLEAGTTLLDDGRRLVIDHTVLEGHRFARRPIAAGEPLLSWGLAFGTALGAIEPGAYVCNKRILAALAARSIEMRLPGTPNFSNDRVPFELDELALRPGFQVDPLTSSGEFQGFARGPRRGVGTRNTIVLLGTSSLAGSYVRALAERLVPLAAEHPTINGIVPVAHTEGGDATPNNLDMVLRTLCGFVVHPNVGAVLCVDCGAEPVCNAALRRTLAEDDYPVQEPDGPRLDFLSLDGSRELSAWIDHGAEIVQPWLKQVGAARRSPQPVSELKLALQCGGSDAFSGVCANPLAGWVARQVIRSGGCANLAETDELIGAEAYMLANVRDIETARVFMATVERFKARAALHGHSAEGNPSGGNLLRGLYNIAIKSIGAARKKAPDVRLDDVIAYGERMQAPGYYFMDSPGNDLESVAGQVASGANLILFTTGNGSITNFPFVPTIKIVSTTARYELVSRDMDVDAGRHLDGAPMEDLGAEAFDLALRVSSGQLSAGERAGHAQVQLWRNWRQTAAAPAPSSGGGEQMDGRPLRRRVEPSSTATFRGCRTRSGFATDAVGVVVPTSLCASQISRLIVDRLNKAESHRPAVSRFACFVHTEGCGASSGENERLFLRTLVGHMAHPMVRCGLFLEHGCEKTHNDAVRQTLEATGLDPTRFGWASVQLDGGIEPVTDKVRAWFSAALGADNGGPIEQDAGAEHLSLAMTASGKVTDAVGAALGAAAERLLSASATVIVPGNSSLLDAAPFVERLGLDQVPRPTLAYAQAPADGGFHVMDAPTGHGAETLTGLGATGAGIMLAAVEGRPMQAHPMVPLLQVAEGEMPDVDLVLGGYADSREAGAAILDLVLRVASRQYEPKLFAQGYTDFQITRGLMGISL
jgi:altronate dehydratase